VAPSSEFSNQSLERLALGALGGALLASKPERAEARLLARSVGLAMIAYAAKPTLEKLALAAGTRRRRVAIHSSMEVERSLPAVFAFFKDFENLPRVIGSLRSVVDYQDGRSHWEAYTPAGQAIEWDCIVSRYVPNSVIGWESVPGSVVDFRAQLRFTRLTPMRTRLDVEAYFAPATTSLADALRALLSVANERRIRGDLDHVRFYLESVLPLTPDDAASAAEPEPAVEAK
jgi:uncharacterized membrane protein